MSCRLLENLKGDSEIKVKFILQLVTCNILKNGVDFI